MLVHFNKWNYKLHNVKYLKHMECNKFNMGLQQNTGFNFRCHKRMARFWSSFDNLKLWPRRWLRKILPPVGERVVGKFVGVF